MRVFLSLIVSLSLLGCGGDGSSDDSFLGAARVGLSISPNSLDTGDRTTIDIFLSDLNFDGVVVKIRYPKSLSYVAETAFLEIGANLKLKFNPVIEASSSLDTYLIFILEPSTIELDRNRVLTLQLRADKAGSGMIGVDADVLEKGITGATFQFNPDNAQFSSEDESSISVEL